MTPAQAALGIEAYARGYRDGRDEAGIPASMHGWSPLQVAEYRRGFANGVADALDGVEE
jgi:hypothetical protein